MDLESSGPACVENQPTQLDDDVIRSGDYQSEEVIGERGRILNIAEQFNDPQNSYVGLSSSSYQSPHLSPSRALSVYRSPSRSLDCQHYISYRITNLVICSFTFPPSII